MWLDSNKDLSYPHIPKLRYSKQYHTEDAKDQAKRELRVLWRGYDEHTIIVI